MKHLPHLVPLVLATLAHSAAQGIDTLPAYTGASADAHADFLISQAPSASAGAGGSRGMTLAEFMKTPVFSTPRTSLPQPAVRLHLPQDFGGSGGDGTRTTGGISAGSSTLTVADGSSFDIGEGIYIAGAGAAGARHVAKVVARTHHTITLTTPAETTVAEAVVQHDDSAAINAALAAAFNAGGGTVFLSNGHWRCNGPFDATTDSILTVPQTGTYSGTPIYIGLFGESVGHTDATHSAYAGGTCIDASDSTSSDNRYLFAGHRHVDHPSKENMPTEWNSIEFRTDGLLYLVDANPSIHGLMLSGVMRADIGDQIRVMAKASAGLFVEPTGYTSGIILPAQLNNIALRVGAAQIVGFQTGITLGEHVVLDRPLVAFCKNGLAASTAGLHAITGTVSVENCNTALFVTAPVTLDLALQMEGGAGDKWYKTVTGNCISDAGNQARGLIKYSMFDLAAGHGPFIGVNGGSKLNFHNLRSIPNVIIATGNGTNQAITPGTYQVVKFETITMDPATAMTSASAGIPSRLGPGIPGWYQLTAAIQYSMLPAGTGATLAVKVAEDIIPLSSQRTGAVAADVTLTGSKLIYFDGTTSVADIVTSHDSGSAATLAGSPLLRSVDLRPVSIPGHP